MIKSDSSKGVTSTVNNFSSRALALVFVAAALFSAACTPSPSANSTGGTADPNEVAARVNGKDIKMEDVEKGVKAQAQGQEASLSPLELASARLTVLQSLIQGEVMFQKAEKEATVPSDDDVNAETNKRKTESGLSAEEFDKQMKAAGETPDSWKLNVKKDIALQKLQEKITGKVEAPKDKEIEDFYNGNKEQFKNKRGAQLAAIVIDPANSGQGDPTTNQDEAMAKAKEVGQKAMTPGMDFAALAREYSEDLQTRSSGGDWRYFTEDELKQTFPANVAAAIMGQFQAGQVIPAAIPLEGKFLILKLQRKQEQDEDLTLESPGVRQRVTELLINARKNLLWQSYSALAMNEAKVENYLAKKVVDNPNELSGARPAGAPGASPAASNGNTNGANTGTNTNMGGNANAASSNSNGGNGRAAAPAANGQAAPPARPSATPAANAAPRANANADR